MERKRAREMKVNHPPNTLHAFLFFFPVFVFFWTCAICFSSFWGFFCNSEVLSAGIWLLHLKGSDQERAA